MNDFEKDLQNILGKTNFIRKLHKVVFYFVIVSTFITCISSGFFAFYLKSPVWFMSFICSLIIFAYYKTEIAFFKKWWVGQKL